MRGGIDMNYIDDFEVSAVEKSEQMNILRRPSVPLFFKYRTAAELNNIIFS